MVTREDFIPLRRAFAMMTLAMVSNKPREYIEHLTKTLPGFAATAMPPDEAERLQNAIVNGDVTCIVANPMPGMRLWYQGSFGNGKSIYGIWTKPASWRGTRAAPPKRVGWLTPEQAMAKGIPLPSEDELRANEGDEP